MYAARSGHDLIMPRTTPLPSTPISWAVWEDDIERMARILDEDPTLLSQVWAGFTVLGYAAHRGQVEMVNLLLSRGADTHSKGEYGKTALMKASAAGHVAVVLLLLRHLGGCGLDERDNYGDTALACACHRGRVEIVRLLLLAGADLTIANNRGETPRQLVEKLSFQERVDLTEMSEPYTFVAS